MTIKRKTPMTSLGIHKSQKEEFKQIISVMKLVEDLPFKLSNIQAFEFLLKEYKEKIKRFNQKQK